VFRHGLPAQRHDFEQTVAFDVPRHGADLTSKVWPPARHAFADDVTFNEILPKALGGTLLLENPDDATMLAQLRPIPERVAHALIPLVEAPPPPPPPPPRPPAMTTARVELTLLRIGEDHSTQSRTRIVEVETSNKLTRAVAERLVRASLPRLARCLDDKNGRQLEREPNEGPFGWGGCPRSQAGRRRSRRGSAMRSTGRTRPGRASSE
jgi:hypothetical protein